MPAEIELYSWSLEVIETTGIGTQQASSSNLIVGIFKIQTPELNFHWPLHHTL